MSYTNQSEHTSLDGLLEDTDVLYVTRVQKERFATEVSQHFLLCGS